MTPENPSKEIGPVEVNAIAGKILELIAENISCSPEILVAALKIAGLTVDETRQATVGAQMRAGILQQYGPKR